MFVLSKSSKETRDLAKSFANQIKSGCVIGLVGDLGSGKTVFAKGFIKAFGNKQKVLSPTFVLMKNYRTNQKNTKIICHIDYYRADVKDKILQAQINEYIQDKQVITIIEWAAKIKYFLPKNTLWIKFKNTKNENERRIQMN